MREREGGRGGGRERGMEGEGESGREGEWRERGGREEQKENMRLVDERGTEEREEEKTCRGEE